MADPTTQKCDIQAAVDAGALTVNAIDRIADVDGIPLAIMPTGMSAVVLKEALATADARAPFPQRRKGTAKHDELPSFIAHVNRFKDEDSAIFAHVERVQLVAVLDYHRKGGVADAQARWGEHRALYACPLSPQWQLWLKFNEKDLTQDAFAQLIDENMADLMGPAGDVAISMDVPTPGAVLDMARKLVVRTKGEFVRQVNETTGEYALVNKLEHESTSTKIFRAFALRIPVFAGADATFYRLEARIRFRLEGGRPIFSYSLYRPDLVLQDAFADVRRLVVEGTNLPLFAGSPE